MSLCYMFERRIVVQILHWRKERDIREKCKWGVELQICVVVQNREFQCDVFRGTNAEL